MNLPGQARLITRWGSAGAIALAGLAAALAVTNTNQLVTLLFTLCGLLVWLFGFRPALSYGLVWLFSKGFWLRLTYHLDSAAGRTEGNWLGSAPAMFLTLVAVAALYQIALSRPRIRRIEPLPWMLAFAGFALLSTLIPGGSPLVKLAGLQRHFFPTMAVAALGFVVCTDSESFRRICRVLLWFATVSVAYALYQHLAGIPIWERAWFESLYVTKGGQLTGWLTIGPGGLEFRVYSSYYSYTEFLFTTVGIALLNLGAIKGGANARDRYLFWAFVLLFLLTLGVTLERMPMVMLLAGALTFWVLARGRTAFKRRILISVAASVGLWFVALLTLSTYLESGIDKLVRLAELTNPFVASSIQDRLSNQWSASLEAIGQRPWGWGLGYGSQTMASKEAARSGMLIAPHNELLQKAVELGLVGALLFACLVASQWRFVWRRLYNATVAEPVRTHLLAYMALLAAFLLCGLVNLTFSGTMGVLFWMATGAVWSLIARVGPESSS